MKNNIIKLMALLLVTNFTYAADFLISKVAIDNHPNKEMRRTYQRCTITRNELVNNIEVRPLDEKNIFVETKTKFKYTDNLGKNRDHIDPARVEGWVRTNYAPHIKVIPEWDAYPGDLLIDKFVNYWIKYKNEKARLAYTIYYDLKGKVAHFEVLNKHGYTLKSYLDSMCPNFFGIQ